MARFFFAFVCLAIGCAPEKVPEPKTYDVGLASLVRMYRDQHGDRIYTGQRVRLHLAARDYRIESREVHWHATPDTPPAVVLEFAYPPADNRAALTVEGTCRGIVRDGKRRSYGVDFHVRVSECVLVRDTPRQPPPAD